MGLEKPKAVRDAKLRGDTDALSRMGREGAKRRILNEDLRNTRRKEILEERAAELLKTESVVDGDVLPPEPSTDVI